MILRLAAIAGFLTLAFPGEGMPKLPRKAPELKIVDPSGKHTLLSGYRGKVVVVEFLLTTCPHCQHTAEMITKLYQDLGSRGFQPLGVAFNQGAAALVPAFVKEFAVPFPVGSASIQDVADYVGASYNDRLMAPQIVVIDRKGMIRAQTPPEGDPNLQDETKLRALIESLLKEK
jgi:peroxiredoxin